MIFRFKNFSVYKLAREFCDEVKRLSKEKFPKEEQFCLTSQLWRALDSVILNIAEGSDRFSDTDFSRFINNSLTSLNEAVACLDLALDNGYITEQENQQYTKKAEKVAEQLMNFGAFLRRQKTKRALSSS